jgi:protein O-GlcNAc transferase
MNVIEIMQRATRAHGAGNLVQAEQLYNEVLTADRRQFDALQMLGILQCQRGNFREAVGLLTRALEVRPRSVDALVNLGRAQFETGNQDEAELSYQRALAIDPNFVLALSNYSIVLRRGGRPEEALALCDKALRSQPNNVQVLNNRANALFDLKRFEDALGGYDRALSFAPGLAQAWLGRANVCHQLRRYGDARAAIDKALALNSGSPEAWLELGNILSAQRGYEGASSAYDKALALDPRLADAWIGRASVLSAQKRYPEEIASYEKLLAMRPNADYASGSRLLAKMQICDWTDWGADCERVIAGVRQSSRVESPSVLLAIPATASDQHRCARAYMSANFPAKSPLWQGGGHQGGKISVAYISSDFREHPVSYLLAGVIERHDRSRFATIAISLGPDDDSEMRRRLKVAFDQFIDVDQKSDLEAAKLLCALDVDIAVDLMGHTREARPGIFAWRPAPVQVGYLGYPGTAGADCIDYILADRRVVPLEQRSSYSEHVVYLPDSYQPNDWRPIADRTPRRREAGLPDEGFVFCSFNQSFKITPEVFDVWMRLLSRIEGSVLWLQAAHPAAMANLCSEAERRGVKSERIVFAPRLARSEDHLARHRLADLFLDTLPYNAHTSASDVLWAGVPVITCMGDTFAGRVAGSLLHAVGLPNLATHSLAEYEALAYKLATERDLLAAARARLAQRADLALFDADRFRRHVETAYSTMHERRLRGEAPEHFSVAPIEP